MANANILFNKRIRVVQTSTLTDSSRSYLKIDQLELVKPQYWPTRAGQTSTPTDLSRSNLNIDRLESVKPQDWPTRVGQTSTLTDSSRSNLNIDRLESVKPQHWPMRVGQICFPPPITYPWSHPWKSDSVNSPNLNACENVRSILKDEVEKRMLSEPLAIRYSRTKMEEHIDAVLRGMEFNLEHFESLLSSYPNRLQAVCDTNGGNTEHRPATKCATYGCFHFFSIMLSLLWGGGGGGAIIVWHPVYD